MWKAAFSGRSETGSVAGRSDSQKKKKSSGSVVSSATRDDRKRSAKSSRGSTYDDYEEGSAYVTAPSSRTGEPRGLTESAVQALSKDDEMDWEDDDKDARNERRSVKSGKSGRSERHRGKSDRSRSRSKEREIEREKARKEEKRKSSSRRESELSKGKSRSGDVYGERAIPEMGSFEQFPGQYAGGVMGQAGQADHMISGGISQGPPNAPDQQFGPTREDSYGHASGYYLDQGESVGYQPGVRTNSPNMLVNPDHHLHAASLEAKPAQDTGSGSAADFFTGDIVMTEEPQPINKPGKQSAPLSSSSSKPSKPGRTSSLGTAAAATAAVGMAAAAGSSQYQKQSSTSYQQQSGGSVSGKAGRKYSENVSPGTVTPQYPPPRETQQGNGSYYGPPPGQQGQGTPSKQGANGAYYGISTTNGGQGTPARPGTDGSNYGPSPGRQSEGKTGKHSSQHSNAGMYTAGAAAAGLAGYAAYETNQHHQQENTQSQQHGSSQYDKSQYDGTQYARPPGYAQSAAYTSGSYADMQQQRAYHEHKGPMTKLKDGFLNLLSTEEDVVKMEAYTEAIGVCKHCFDPRSSPWDAPRRHHYHSHSPRRDSFEDLRRRRSLDKMRKHGSREHLAGRVDKDSRYYASDSKRKSGSKADLAAAGLAGVGLAAGANALFNSGKDFEDTYSVRSGHRASSARRRSRSSSTEHGRKSEHGVIGRDSQDDYVFVRTKDGRTEKRRVQRSRSRSNDRRSNMMGAAAGAALGASAVTAGSSRRRHSRSRSRSSSPGLSGILGFSDSKSKRGRHSPNGSPYNISQRPGREKQQSSGMFGGFFTSPPPKRRNSKREHRKKKAGFFDFGNGSSSSSDNEMAFGDGFSSKTNLPLRRKSSNRSVKRKGSDQRLAATVAGIGATAAALAAAQKGNRITKRTSRPELGAKRRQVAQQEPSDEDWEDELPSDASSGSSLAFGNEDYNRRLSRQQSKDSMTSNGSGAGGLGAWGWRWGGKKDKKKRRVPSPPPAYPPRPDASIITPAAAAAGVATRDTVRPSYDSRGSSMSGVPQKPMQFVDPRPVSEESSILGSNRIAMPGSFDIDEDLPVIRPGPSPLQQPQPIAPIQPAFTERTSHEDIFNDRPKPRRTVSSPTQSSFGMKDAALIGAAAIGTASIIASQSGRRSREPKDVRFGLTDEQQAKEDREKRNRREKAERAELAKADRERALKEEAARFTREQDVLRRREEENRRAAEVQMEREREKEAELGRAADRERAQLEEADRFAREQNVPTRREEENRRAVNAQVETEREAERQRMKASEAEGLREAERQGIMHREQEARDSEKNRRQDTLRREEEARTAEELRRNDTSRREEEARKAEDVRRSDEARRRREAEIDAEIEAKRRELEEEQRRKPQRRDSQSDKKPKPQRRDSQGDKKSERSSSIPWGAVAAGAAGAAAAGAVYTGVEKEREKEREARDRDAYTAREIAPTKESPELRDRDVFDPSFFKRKRSPNRSPSGDRQIEEIARKAFAKIRDEGEGGDYDQMIAEKEEYYHEPQRSQADVFAPKEILERKAGYKEHAPDPMGDNDVRIVRDGEGKGHVFDDELYGPKDFGRSRHAPFGVPRMGLIAPTPPPEVRTKKERNRREQSPLSRDEVGSKSEVGAKPEKDRDDDYRDSRSEPGGRKSSRSRSISWGEPQTHVYEVRTPESFRESTDDFFSAKDVGAGAATAATAAAVGGAAMYAANDRNNDKHSRNESSGKRRDAEIDDILDATPEGDDGYRKPFFESVSDLGFNVDSPGTEGAPPVRGFVEGEVERTPKEERSPHIPGGWDDELKDGEYFDAQPVSNLVSSDVPLEREAPAVIEEPAWEPSLSNKDKKKREKGAKRGSTFEYDLPTPPVAEPEPILETVASVEDDIPYEMLSKKDKKKRDKAKRASMLEDDLPTPSTAEPEPEPVEISTPKAEEEIPYELLSKKEQKKRDKAKRASMLEDDLPTPTIAEPEFVQEPTHLAEAEVPYEMLSKKDKKKRDKLKRSMSEDIASSPPEPETIAAPEPEPAWGPPLSKKEQKKREKESKKNGFGDVAAAAMTTAGIAAVAGAATAEDDSESWDSPSTKKGKKGKKAKAVERDIRDIEPTADSMPGGWEPERTAETPPEVIDPFQFQVQDSSPSPPIATPLADAPREVDPMDEFADFKSSKKSKKQAKRDSLRFNEPGVSSPLRAEVAFDDYIGQQAQAGAEAPTNGHVEEVKPAQEAAPEERSSRRTKYEVDDRPLTESPSRISPDDVRSVASEPTGARERRRRSKGDYRTSDYYEEGETDPYDDVRSVAASEPADLYEKRKSKRRSKGESRGNDYYEEGETDPYDDMRSVATSEPADLYEKRNSKRRSRVEDDDTASVVSSRSRRDKDEEGKKEKKGFFGGLFGKKTSPPPSKSDGASLSRTSTRDSKNGDDEDGERRHRRRKSEHGDDDDTRSVTSESRQRHHHRRRTDEEHPRSPSESGSRHHRRRGTGDSYHSSSNKDKEDQDQSFLGMRVEDMPPLPDSRPASPTSAAHGQGLGTSGIAERETKDSGDFNSGGRIFQGPGETVQANEFDQVKEAEREKALKSLGGGDLDDGGLAVPAELIERNQRTPGMVAAQVTRVPELEGALDYLPALPESPPGSPTEVRQTQTPHRPLPLQRPTSTTAVPLRFPYGKSPSTPGQGRMERAISFGGHLPSSPSTPHSSHKTRQGRPTSTEMMPLYLVEHTRKTPAMEETLPSLPSSKPSSRASSIVGSDEWEDANEEFGSPLSHRGWGRGLAIDTHSANAGFAEAGEDYLDSQQTTPRATERPEDPFAAATKTPRQEPEYWTWKDFEREQEQDPPRERGERPEPQFYTWEDYERDEALHRRTDEPGEITEQLEEDLPALPPSRLSSRTQRKSESESESESGDFAKGVAAAALAGGAAVLGYNALKDRDEDAAATEMEKTSLSREASFSSKKKKKGKKGKKQPTFEDALEEPEAPAQSSALPAELPRRDTETFLDSEKTMEEGDAAGEVEQTEVFTLAKSNDLDRFVETEDRLEAGSGLKESVEGVGVDQQKDMLSSPTDAEFFEAEQHAEEGAWPQDNHDRAVQADDKIRSLDDMAPAAVGVPLTAGIIGKPIDEALRSGDDDVVPPQDTGHTFIEPDQSPFSAVEVGKAAPSLPTLTTDTSFEQPTGLPAEDRSIADTATSTDPHLPTLEKQPSPNQFQEFVAVPAPVEASTAMDVEAQPEAEFASLLTRKQSKKSKKAQKKGGAKKALDDVLASDAGAESSAQEPVAVQNDATKAVEDPTVIDQSTATEPVSETPATAERNVAESISESKIEPMEDTTTTHPDPSDEWQTRPSLSRKPSKKAKKKQKQRLYVFAEDEPADGPSEAKASEPAQISTESDNVPAESTTAVGAVPVLSPAIEIEPSQASMPLPEDPEGQPRRTELEAQPESFASEDAVLNAILQDTTAPSLDLQEPAKRRVVEAVEEDQLSEDPTVLNAILQDTSLPSVDTQRLVEESTLNDDPEAKFAQPEVSRETLDELAEPQSTSDALDVEHTPLDEPVDGTAWPTSSKKKGKKDKKAKRAAAQALAWDKEPVVASEEPSATIVDGEPKSDLVETAIEVPIATDAQKEEPVVTQESLDATLETRTLIEGQPMQIEEPTVTLDEPVPTQEIDVNKEATATEQAPVAENEEAEDFWAVTSKKKKGKKGKKAVTSLEQDMSFTEEADTTAQPTKSRELTQNAQDAPEIPRDIEMAEQPVTAAETEDWALPSSRKKKKGKKDAKAIISASVAEEDSVTPMEPEVVDLNAVTGAQDMPTESIESQGKAPISIEQASAEAAAEDFWTSLPAKKTGKKGKRATFDAFNAEEPGTSIPSEATNPATRDVLSETTEQPFEAPQNVTRAQPALVVTEADDFWTPFPASKTKKGKKSKRFEPETYLEQEEAGFVTPAVETPIVAQAEEPALTTALPAGDAQADVPRDVSPLTTHQPNEEGSVPMHLDESGGSVAQEPGTVEVESQQPEDPALTVPLPEQDQEIVSTADAPSAAEEAIIPPTEASEPLPVKSVVEDDDMWALPTKKKKGKKGKKGQSQPEATVAAEDDPGLTPQVEVGEDRDALPSAQADPVPQDLEPSEDTFWAPTASKKKKGKKVKTFGLEPEIDAKPQLEEDSPEEASITAESIAAPPELPPLPLEPVETLPQQTGNAKDDFWPTTSKKSKKAKKGKSTEQVLSENATADEIAEVVVDTIEEPSPAAMETSEPQQTPAAEPDEFWAPSSKKKKGKKNRSLEPSSVSEDVPPAETALTAGDNITEEHSLLPQESLELQQAAPVAEEEDIWALPSKKKRGKKGKKPEAEERLAQETAQEETVDVERSTSHTTTVAAHGETQPRADAEEHFWTAPTKAKKGKKGRKSGIQTSVALEEDKAVTTIEPDDTMVPVSDNSAEQEDITAIQETPGAAPFIAEEVAQDVRPSDRALLVEPVSIVEASAAPDANQPDEPTLLADIVDLRQGPEVTEHRRSEPFIADEASNLYSDASTLPSSIQQMTEASTMAAEEQQGGRGPETSPSSALELEETQALPSADRNFVDTTQEPEQFQLELDAPAHADAGRVDAPLHSMEAEPTPGDEDADSFWAPSSKKKKKGKKGRQSTVDFSATPDETVIAVEPSTALVEAEQIDVDVEAVVAPQNTSTPVTVAEPPAEDMESFWAVPPKGKKGKKAKKGKRATFDFEDQPDADTAATEAGEAQVSVDAEAEAIQPAETTGVSDAVYADDIETYEAKFVPESSTAEERDLITTTPMSDRLDRTVEVGAAPTTSLHDNPRKDLVRDRWEQMRPTDDVQEDLQMRNEYPSLDKKNQSKSIEPEEVEPSEHAAYNEESADETEEDSSFAFTTKKSRKDKKKGNKAKASAEEWWPEESSDAVAAPSADNNDPSGLPGAIIGGALGAAGIAALTPDQDIEQTAQQDDGEWSAFSTKKSKKDKRKGKKSGTATPATPLEEERSQYITEADSFPRRAEDAEFERASLGLQELGSTLDEQALASDPLHPAQSEYIEREVLPIATTEDTAVPRGLDRMETDGQRDLDFTATVAAGLQDTGFDPEMVVNDPVFHRRATPPGATGEADPEEVFESFSKKKKKKGKKDRQSDLASDDQSRDVSGVQTPQDSANQDSANDFDEVLTKSLEGTGVDTAALEQAAKEEEATSSNGLTGDRADFSFATARRKKGKKKAQTIEEGQTVDTPANSAADTADPMSAIDERPSQGAPSDDIAPQMNTTTEAKDTSTGPTPRPKLSRQLTIDTNTTEPTSTLTSTPGTPLLDPAADLVHAGERDMDVDDMDKAYRAYKRNKRKQKKQKWAGIQAEESASETPQAVEEIIPPPESLRKEVSNEAADAVLGQRERDNVEQADFAPRSESVARGLSGRLPRRSSDAEGDVDDFLHTSEMSQGLPKALERTPSPPVQGRAERSPSPEYTKGVSSARRSLSGVDAAGLGAAATAAATGAGALLERSSSRDHRRSGNSFGAAESPVLGDKEHQIIRDSGYQETSSPRWSRQSADSSSRTMPDIRATRSKESLHSRRSNEALYISTDTGPQWDLKTPKKRSANVESEEARTLHARTPSQTTQDTPLEPTSRNRASYLFQTTPEGLRSASLEAAATPTQANDPRATGYFPTDEGGSAFGPERSTSTSDRAAFSPPPTGIMSPRIPLDTIPEEHLALKRSIGALDAKGPDHKAIRRTETPQSIRARERALSPTGLPPLQTTSTAARSVSNPGIDELARRSDIRSPSVMSSRSNVSANHWKSPDELRSYSRTSNRSNTPSLRRTSLSGDLRAASLRGDSGSAVGARSSPKTIPFEAPPTPPSNDDEVMTAGASRSMDPNEVYQGYGDAQGSQVSPTRPPSMRKRQSMHIMDLESQLQQLSAENQALQFAKQDNGSSRGLDGQSLEETLRTRDLEVQQKDNEIYQIRAMLQPMQDEIARLTEMNNGLTEANRNLVDDSNSRYAGLQEEHAQAHEQWQTASRELESVRQEHGQLTSGLRAAVEAQLATALASKNSEIRELKEELDIATEKIRALQVQIQSTKGRDFLTVRDEDYFDGACQKLCQHVQQWVLRFSKVSDNRICRLSTDLKDDKVEARLDNAVLDSSDVDKLLGDRVKRRDVFMSVVMTMVWEFVFTRYLFGMDREQRQKLKALEKILSEVGPPRAVAQWRATTLTLLAKRPIFGEQRDRDELAVAREIFELLCALLPPPSSNEEQLLSSLQRVVHIAVDLSIEMRTQRSEYIMLPPLLPEYDTNGDLVQKVHFNASLMNERSGMFSSNEELEQTRAVVKIVLFPLVVKKGDEVGEGEEEIVVCPAQVLVHNDNAKGKKVVRVESGHMTIDDPRRSRASLVSAGTMGSGAF